MLIGAGSAFYVWVLTSTALPVGLHWWTLIIWLSASGLLAIVGALFLCAARRPNPLFDADSRWWQRSMHYLIAAGVPILVGLGVSVESAIRVAYRVDDGDYGVRFIQGNGVTLIWAPAGLGWQTGVRRNEIALYGLLPVGFDGKASGRNGQCNQQRSEGCASAADMQQCNVCRYLSDDGARSLWEAAARHCSHAN